jgi:dipeptidyl aminopeptidase/acylaminoacyl peptidase
MAGDLYLPRGLKPEKKLPAIVLCAGTGGTKGGTQARLAPRFAQQGYIVLAFDYRGWGQSESQLMAVAPQPKPDGKNEMTITVKALRWQMNYTDQTADIRAAISFIAGEPNVDPGRIGLWGSSYGGGLVTWVGGNDPRVKCIVTQVPGMGGGRGPAALKSQYDLATRQARGAIEPVPIESGRMTGKMAAYENMRVNPVKNIGFSALEAAAKIRVPTLFVVAENEELSSNATVESVHQGLLGRGVASRLHVIKGITHYGVYGEGFEEATRVELEWFATHLQGPAEAGLPAPARTRQP